QPEHPRGRFVSGNYFSVLGVGAAHGRVFDGSEDSSVGASPIVVISDGYWERRFHRDPAAIGRQIIVNNTKLTIAGVTPAGFSGEIVGTTNDLWLPVTMQGALKPNGRLLDNPQAYWLLLLGRLAPGVSFEQAQNGYTTLVRQMVRETVPASARGTEDDVRKLRVYV